ncbi:MAG: HAD family hydrolase [Bdellovibrionaceae bacterium]|nr:HAD family hydrolase [Pseudobdellovibrionaceae bacterium]
MKPAILLDRDGTIIIDKNYLNSPDGVEFLPGAIEGLKAFGENGYTLVVVTNQSGVARGLVQEENILLIHKKMDELLAAHDVKIAAYYYSTAAADSNDPDRKPNPGMLEKAIKDLNLEREKSWMIGDREADIQAGIAAKVRTVFIENSTHKLNTKTLPWYQVKNLFDASQLILSSVKN